MKQEFTSEALSAEELASKTVFTGVKPTGTPHLGNYVGAIRPALKLAEKAGKSYLFIADLHAVNSMIGRPEDINQNTTVIAATFLALGLDPQKTILFRQSDVASIAQLANLLGNVTTKSLMDRGVVHKDAVAKNIEQGRDENAGVNMGQYSYPLLMASDILSFGSDLVPVGKDQVQHVEMARDIAKRFQSEYGRVAKDVFSPLPEAYIDPVAESIAGLDGRKMSKSYGNTIEIFEGSLKTLQRKINKKIATDSASIDDPKPLDGSPEDTTIAKLFKQFAPADEYEGLLERFRDGGSGYGHEKKLLAETIWSHFGEAREKYVEYMNKPEMVEEVLQAGAATARLQADKVFEQVHEAMLGRKQPKQSCDLKR